MAKLVNDRKTDFNRAHKIANKYASKLSETQKAEVLKRLYRLPVFRREHDKLVKEFGGFINTEHEFYVKMKHNKLSKDATEVILISLKNNINIWDKEKGRVAKKINADEAYLKKIGVSVTWDGAYLK